MRRSPKSEIQRLNDQIVGYLLLNRSPPRELVAARDQALAGLGRGPIGSPALAPFDTAPGSRTRH